MQLFWGWGAFPPFVCVASCLLGLPLGTTAQPGEQVSFKAALPFSGGAGCHFWMASDVAQVKRDGESDQDSEVPLPAHHPPSFGRQVGVSVASR